MSRLSELTKVTVNAIGSLGAAPRQDGRRCPARAWPSTAPSPPSRAVPWSSLPPQARFWRLHRLRSVARDHGATEVRLGRGDRRGDQACGLSDGPACADGRRSHALSHGCGPSPPAHGRALCPPSGSAERRRRRLRVVRWTPRTDRPTPHHDGRCNNPCLGGTWCRSSSHS